MYRVEDTMSRIALASGNFRLVSYVTQTGLFIGLDRTSTIRMEQITNRSINLEKVVKVNDLSRKYVASELTLEELYCELQAIDRDRSFFPVWLQIVSAAVISGTIMVLFGGKMTDLPVTLVIGGLGYAAYLYSLKFLESNFYRNFIFFIDWHSRYLQRTFWLRKQSGSNHYRMCDAFSSWSSNYERYP